MSALSTAPAAALDCHADLHSHVFIFKQIAMHDAINPTQTGICLKKPSESAQSL